MASSCYPGSPAYDPALCLKVQDDYANSKARASVYGSAQSLQWESCGIAQCQLNALNPSDPPTSSQCSLGSLSAYYVDAASAEHVVATVEFIRKHNLRLSIKNTGHDYLGRSFAANSLALWTHNIKSLEFHDTFTAAKCSVADGKNIAVIGAGVVGAEAIPFFEQYGMDVTVGAVETVGLAGGFGQGGGHGILSPSFGLMVDQAIEFDVVLANGTLRTINQCNDPDLFWAMRGGGGGTYAILINYKFKVHPAQPVSVYSFRASFPNSTKMMSKNDSTAYYPSILTAFVNNQTTWSDQNVSGYHYFDPLSFETHLMLPTHLPLPHLKSLTSSWAKHLASLPHLDVVENDYYQLPCYSAYQAHIAPAVARRSGVAFSVVESGRLVPRELFLQPNSEALVKALLTGMELSALPDVPNAHVSLFVAATTPVNGPKGNGTSVHEAWRDALWTIDFVSAYSSKAKAATVKRIWKAVRDAIVPIRYLTPGGGNYVNEGDYGDPEWQANFFGSNYGRLLEIKNRYDSEGMFNCWKCVGWTGEAE